MQSKLTVSDVQNVLVDYSTGAANFMSELSQIMAEYYDRGCFKDMLHTISFPNGAGSGIITLNQYLLSLHGIALQGGGPVPIYGQMHDWHELGYGPVPASEMSMQGVIDQGDGWCTFADIETAGTLKFKILNAADAGKQVRIFGLGTYDGVENQPLRDGSGDLGVTLATVNPTATTTQTFSSLKMPDGGAIQLPSMVGTSELYVVNGATETLLARYQPLETRPCWRRYKTGITDQVILAFCQGRFIPYHAATDWVRPPCIGAIRAGFQALTKEKALDYTESEKIWGVGSGKLMNQLRQYRGGAKPVFSLDHSKFRSGSPGII